MFLGGIERDQCHEMGQDEFSRSLSHTGFITMYLHGVLTLLNLPPSLGFNPILELTPSPRRCWAMTLKKVRIVRLLANA